MKFARQMTCLVSLLVLTAPSFADRIELSNGDRISGKLIEQATDKVIIETDYAGKLEVKRSEVRQIETDQVLRIRLQDGTEYDGTLTIDEQGQINIQATDQTSSSISGLEAIAAITAIPSSEPPKYEWRGNITVGGEAKRGNTDTDSLVVDGRVVTEKKEINRYTVTAKMAREHTDGDLSRDQYLLAGKYDHFFAKQWYGYLGAGFENDQFKDLNLRSIFSAGSGYQFFDSDELRLSLEAGLSYTDEDYDKDEDNSYAGFMWGLDWEQALFDKRLNFFHRHRGNQGFDESDNTIIWASTGLRAPLALGISATAQYDINWDNSPAEGTKSTDHTYIFGLGYDW